MATSLAQQLQKLQVSQTAALVHRKRFPSILFDHKVAAEKDRDTIFEIARDGLDELIQLNPVFEQFRSTLFDVGTKTLERFVEMQETDKKLTAEIKRFIYHLSPFFLLQAAHKCLEWLIRRFHVQDYNQDELMTLILPYHETNVAVKCIQTMSLRNPNNKWHWLEKVKKTGASISKQAIINRCVESLALLEFIGNFTYEAIKEWDNRAGNLHVMINFYCQVTTAVLNISKVSENHVKAVFVPLLRGFEKLIPDFTASSFMIATVLVSKKQLSTNMSKKLAIQAISCRNQQFFENAVILLACIAENQAYFQISTVLLEEILNKQWFLQALSIIHNFGVNIEALLVYLVRACLKNIQTKTNYESMCRQFCENLKKELTFKSTVAKKLIYCILESYETQQNELSDTPISLSSNESMKFISDEQVTQWFVTFLKQFQIEYPTEFDEIVEEISIGDDKHSKTNALKNILGKFFLSLLFGKYSQNLNSFLSQVTFLNFRVAEAK